MSSIPALKGLSPDSPLTHDRVNACFDTSVHANRAWEMIQKLVKLLGYVHGADDLPIQLEPLRDIDIHELGRGIDGLTVDDFCHLATMAEAFQVVDPVHAELAGLTWTDDDLQAMNSLYGTLWPTCRRSGPRRP